jgi:hypothetical protein
MHNRRKRAWCHDPRIQPEIIQDTQIFQCLIERNALQGAAIFHDRPRRDISGRLLAIAIGWVADRRRPGLI